MTNDLPDTLIEAVRYFSDLDVCTAYMRKIKWPDGKITCPNCGAHGDRIGEIATRRMLRCKDCRKQFSCKVGTIFEDSPLGLDKWFVAVWCIAAAKNGISSHELGRALGVTQKTAWFMLHRIRKAMETNTFQKFDGPAEADTTYVGGAASNMHKAKREKKIKGRGAVGKTAVLSQVTTAKTKRELDLERALKRQAESHASIMLVLSGGPTDAGKAGCIKQCDDFVAEAHRALGICDLRGSDPDDPDIYGN